MGSYIIVVVVAATVGLIIAKAMNMSQAEIVHNYVEANQCHLVKSAELVKGANIYACPNDEIIFYVR